MINITFPDGAVREFESGVTTFEIAQSISNSLAKKALAGKFNGKLIDTTRAITEDGSIEIVTPDHEDALPILRHSAAHLFAQAARRLFPDIHLGVGPAIEDGFYYDTDNEAGQISNEDLSRIEEEMKKIVKENFPSIREEVTKDEAREIFKNDPYKLELIEEHSEDEGGLTIYRQGEYVDLCRGPHVPSTGRIQVFHLLNVAGAYWRGDSKNKMLQRIYATAFFSKEDLDHYLFVRAEAEKRDHRKLGKQLDLFSFHEEGPGFPFFHPKGMILRNKLMDYERELFKEFGYVEIMTPVILSKKLWLQSGHWDHYKENMYFTQIDDEDYAIKPMNCPGGILFFKTQQRSYRDLPMRVGEFGLVHRHELKGALHGLFRVRCFTQDDAHIFMTQEQMKDEVIKCMAMYQKMYGVFGLEYHVELSTRPENSMGSDELWEISTNALREAIETAGVPYQINEGDGAFYGPKLDFHVQDSLGRTWQCGTIQMDMQLPERFDVNYIGEDGEKHRAVMLHRAGYGSLERFIGILIEHYAGAFPTWIAPVQAKIIPVTDKNLEYAKSVAAAMSESDIRVEVEEANETLGYKIRKAQMEKVPYMIIVGDQEMKGHTISVRSRKNGDLGSQSLPMFVANLIREIKEREN